MKDISSISPTPFLKWAGGKRALAPKILERFPEHFDRYIEPFVGAGSLMFSVEPQVPKLINDYNRELISTYEVIRDDLRGLLRELNKHQNTKEHYLSVRQWDRLGNFSRRTTTSRAARFIYLNKCGFNGLYRVNSKGQYNVPYGSPKSVDFIQKSNLERVNEFLNCVDSAGKNLVLLTSMDYKCVLQEAKAGDFVYLDPPYDPISSTSSFTSYNENGFSQQDQKDLRDEILQLTDRGAKVLLSNSNSALINNLYSDQDVFDIEKIDVRRAIAAKKNSRGIISEVLISNYRTTK